MDWLFAIWAIAAIVFLAKLDKRQLSVIVIVLSILVFVSMRRSQHHPSAPPVKGAVLVAGPFSVTVG